MRNAHIVTPGKEEPVEIVGFAQLPNGNYRLLLRCGLKEYHRVVTPKGMAAISHEAITVLVWAGSEVAA